MVGVRLRPGRTFRIALGIAVVLAAPFLRPGSAQTPEPEQVVEVRVQGNQTISTARILSEVKTRAGRPFNQERIIQDVRKLAARSWFVNVQPLYEDAPGGRIVIFQVVERPTLRYVKYLGNTSIRDKNLIKETGLKVGASVDPYAIDEGRRKIEDFYKERGFNKVRVSVLEGNKATDRGAVYVISEGQKQKIWHVGFVGNKIASGARLKTKIQSKPGFLWLFKGYVDPKQIDEDVDRLTAYYRSLGFFRARIGRELEYNEAGDWLTLKFVIDEGPRFKVRNVSFVGNKKFRDDQFTGLLKTQAGDYFDQGAMNVDAGTLRDVYGSQGYVFADVKASPRTLEGEPELDLVYEISEGSRYRVGRITVHVEGDNPHTRRQAVLNRVSLSTGDIVDIRKLRNSERRLRASGIFASDPQTGAAPRIVFSPPGSKDTRTAKKRGGFRGQSPDSPPSYSSGDQVLNMTVQGEFAPDLYRQPTKPTPQQIRKNPNSNSYHPPVEEHHIYRTGKEVQTGRFMLGVGVNSDAGVKSSVRRPAKATPQQVRKPYLPRSRPVTGRTVVRGQSPGGGGYGGQAVGAVGPGGQGQRYPASTTNPTVAGGSTPLNTTGTAPRQYNPATGTYTAGSPAGGAVQTALVPSGADGQLPTYSQPYNPNPYYEPLEDLPLGIIVEETQTGRFMLGVGVNSDAGVVGSITIDEQNFDWRKFPRTWDELTSGTAWRGGGQRFRLELMPGTQVQRYLVSFQEPYLMDTAVSLGLSGFFYDRRFIDWDEQRLGGRISLGYQLSPDLSTTFSYRGEKVNIHNPVIPSPPELAEVVGDNTLHGFRLSLRHDTRDNTFLATEGHYIELSGEQVIGTFEYPRAELDARQYFLVHQRPDGSGRHVISTTGRLGFTGSNTPLYDHFFAGGFSTLRGFDFRGASPRTGGVEVGGEFLMLGSVEYLFPVTAGDMLRAVAFCDFGTVEKDIEINDFRVSPGVGLRVTVPAMGPAPIALDFAFPIVQNPNDDTQVFSFNVGFLR